jgi:dipeptidyl aminopeptidase/acylaminoacyl peptidase
MNRFTLPTLLSTCVHRLRAGWPAAIGLIPLAACVYSSSEIRRQPAERPAAVAQRATAQLAATPVARFMEIRAGTSPVLAPDGALYVRDYPEGTNQVYRFDGVAGPGRTSTQLTRFTDGMSSFSLAPDARRLIVAVGSGGNEQTQLYAIDIAAGGSAGPVQSLLENPAAVFRLNTWFHDGSGFIYSANTESSADFYLYRYDFETKDGAGASSRLLGKPGTWSAADVTRDARRALVGHFISASDSEVFELDTQDGKLTPIALGSGAADGRAAANESTSQTSVVGYMAGEQSALFQSDSEGGTRRLWLFDLETKTARRPVAALDGFEVDSARINDARDLCAVVTNEDGYGVLHLFRLPGFEPVELPPIERGVISVEDMRGNRILWTLSNARTPSLSFAWEVPGPGAKSRPPQQITFAENRGIDVGSFTLPKLVHYKSFDGLEIPAFLYLPPSYKQGQKIPFVASFHGGPEGQSRPGFDRTVQALVAHGFGVLQPNVRGSTGYGRAYQMMDDYKNRWASVKDGAEGARWLVKQGYAAPKEIATYGGSYGGFMSVAVAIEGKDVIGAGVDVVGIVNFKTFLEQTKGYRKKLREAEYGPLSDPEFLTSISPLTRAGEIEIPMLIAHGLNDPRVPVGEAMQLAVNLQSRGLDPELYFFPDEGHGFQKLANRILFAERMVRFLERTIGRPGT